MPMAVKAPAAGVSAPASKFTTEREKPPVTGNPPDGKPVPEAFLVMSEIHHKIKIYLSLSCHFLWIKQLFYLIFS
jgi:hypothetical protein